MKLYDKFTTIYSVVALVVLAVFVGCNICSTQEVRVFLQIAGLSIAFIAGIVVLVLAYIYLPYWFSKVEDCFFSFCENRLSGLTDKVDNLLAIANTKIGIIIIDIASIICVSSYCISWYLGKGVEVGQVSIAICLVIQLVERTYYRVKAG